MKLQQRIARATLPLTVLACGVTAHAQTLVRAINGPAVNAKYGKVCLTVPDVNADGYDDLIVGAPGLNQDRGAIYCLSGAYVAFGTGTQTLWSLAPTANAGDRFGAAIADVGDITGDGVHDYLVGQPGYDVMTTSDIGAVRLVNGALHTAVSLITGTTAGCSFGSAVAECGDANGDGGSEVAIGAPGPLSPDSRLYALNSAQLLLSGSIDSLTSGYSILPSGAELAASLAGGFDIDGDGFEEFVVGAPGYDSAGFPDAGAAYLYTRLPSFNQFRAGYFSSISGERLGASVDLGQDFDGDGVGDIVVGAPNSPNGTAFEVGRAVVLSGARLLALTPPYELYTLPFGSPAPPINHSDPDPDFHFGAAVRASPDLNGDGLGEILVGVPDFFTAGFTGFSFKGLVMIYSGFSGSQLTSVVGASTDRLGDGLAGALEDLDGDGLPEFVVGGSRSDAGGTDSGVVKCYRLFPLPPPYTFCTSKINSLGCAPSIASIGSPEAISAAPFLITASNVINQKTGLLFYSHRSTSQSFQGGFKCAANPVRRTGALNSGGSSSGSDCSGNFSLDFNARIANGVDPLLVAGAEIYAQYWSRDPGSPSMTSLSNALAFFINP